MKIEWGCPMEFRSVGGPMEFSYVWEGPPPGFLMESPLSFTASPK